MHQSRTYDEAGLSRNRFKGKTHKRLKNVWNGLENDWCFIVREDSY